MVLKHGGPRLTKIISYVILTPLPQELRDMCPDWILIVLLYNSNWELNMVLLALKDFLKRWTEKP